MTDAQKAIKDFEHYQESGYAKSETPSSASTCTALSALRAQLERSKGCEHCTGDRTPFEIGQNAAAKIIDDSKGKYLLQVYNPETCIELPIAKCLFCGRELEG